MATYIKTENNKNVSYQIEPDTAVEMLKNINDVYPEKELDELFKDVSTVDISDKITLTPEANCEEATLVKAVKIANVAYLDIRLKPSTAIGSNGYLRFIVSGLKTSMPEQAKLMIGNTMSNSFHVWIHSIASNGDITFGCKMLPQGTWAIDSSIEITGYIPLENEV